MYRNTTCLMTALHSCPLRQPLVEKRVISVLDLPLQVLTWKVTQQETMSPSVSLTKPKGSGKRVKS